MAYLEFIDDDVLINLVADVLSVGKLASDKAKHNMWRNVVDPFSALFEMAVSEVDMQVWIKLEQQRQAQKSLANHIGSFHQKILGNISGWQDLGSSDMVDLANTSLKIIAEVKNKYNTVKASDEAGLYLDLHKRVMDKGQKYKNFTAYYVQVIPKKNVRYDICFTPSDRRIGEKCPENKLIRKIDGASFYALVTGRKDALLELYTVLPWVISDIIKNKSFCDAGSNELLELFKRAYG